MKKNTLYLFILLLITGLNTSCNYLDIVPDETWKIFKWDDGKRAV